MARKIKVIVNAIPLNNVNTGISRYLRSLYTELERLYGDRMEVGYFDGIGISSSMPCGPDNFSRWSKSVELFWRLPAYAALFVRLGSHLVRERVFRKLANGYDLYHEAAFFPFSVPFRVKTVFTIHDLSVMRFPEHHPRERVLYSRLFFRRSCETVDYFLADSEFIAKEMGLFLNIDSQRISVAHLAHEGKWFYPRPFEDVENFRVSSRLPEEHFLFVGSGDPRKNLHIIPQALKNAGLKIPLLAAGWQGWASKSEWDNVIFLDWVSDDDLARLYSGALALIFPSSYEGFGLPILEAMACGCPVVTTKEASLPEVAGDAALYMKEPRDVDGLAEILKKLASSPALRQDLSVKGLSHVDKFSWASTAQTTFQAFEQVLRS
jgi:glycosyltransferase involved in cell wall biosynthesis